MAESGGLDPHTLSGPIWLATSLGRLPDSLSKLCCGERRSRTPDPFRSALLSRQAPALTEFTLQKVPGPDTPFGCSHLAGGQERTLPTLGVDSNAEGLKPLRKAEVLPLIPLQVHADFQPGMDAGPCDLPLWT